MTDNDDDLPTRLRKAAWYKRRNGDDVLMNEAADELDARAACIAELGAEEIGKWRFFR